MGTPHIAAEKGQIAERVLLPGDPLRAKFIAENFLEDVTCYSKVRNAFGFTGTYKGKRVSIQATGMGMPSIGIYARELMEGYGCKRLIRTGTCGSISPEFDLFDVVIAQAAASDSGIFARRFGSGFSYPAVSDFHLACDAVKKANELGIEPKVRTVFTGDRFYDDDTTDLYAKLNEYNIACIEMECAELFMLGQKFRTQTLGILTVSDMMLENRIATTEEREKAVTKMITLALETV